MHIKINAIQAEKIYRLARYTGDLTLHNYLKLIRVRTNDMAEFAATDSYRAAKIEIPYNDSNGAEYFLPATIFEKAQRLKLEEFELELTEEEAHLVSDGVHLWQKIDMEETKRYPKIDAIFERAAGYHTHAEITASSKEIVRACRVLEALKPKVIGTKKHNYKDYSITIMFGREAIHIGDEEAKQTILSLPAKISGAFKARVNFRFLAEAIRLSSHWNDPKIVFSGDMAGEEEYSLRPIRVFSHNADHNAESLIMPMLPPENSKGYSRPT